MRKLRKLKNQRPHVFRRWIRGFLRHDARSIKEIKRAIKQMEAK